MATSDRSVLSAVEHLTENRRTPVRVLLVESDRRLARCVAAGLRRQGFDVDHVATGGEALRACRQADVVLLDVGVPDTPGPRLCRDIRAVADVPVVAVTADRTEAARVRALRAGADDCLDKPYGFRELVARIEAVMRRRRAARPRDAGTASACDDSPVRVDAVTREARIGERCLALTEKEFDLLHLLVSRSGTVVPREEIMLNVWGDAWNKRSRTVDTHVAGLRRKLGDDRWIVTVRGVGFRFAPPGRPAPVRYTAPTVGARTSGSRPAGRVTGGPPAAEPLRVVRPASGAHDRQHRQRREPGTARKSGGLRAAERSGWPPVGAVLSKRAAGASMHSPPTGEHPSHLQQRGSS
ncbi:response regulator transcription factor [Streptomyces sp. NPDC003011]